MKIRINKEQSSLLNCFMSRDIGRHVLRHYGVKGGYLYATDGRRCVRFKMNFPIKDGTYKAFTDGQDAYLFEVDDLFPSADKIMPDFSRLVEICKISPQKSDGISIANAIIDIYSKTKRPLNIKYITDLDIGGHREYSVFTKKGEETDAGGYLYFQGNFEDNFFGKPEIVILPYRKE